MRSLLPWSGRLLHGLPLEVCSQTLRTAQRLHNFEREP
jgi:hypothetical protein